MIQNKLHIIECPRDAMQGIKEIIDIDLKVKYLNQLLKVGFHTIDFGSFVSPKAIPQMADTALVLEKIAPNKNGNKLLAIVANTRGATEAVKYEAIDILGYPFSISETFQLRNTNSTISEAFEDVKAIAALCHKHKKELVIYISMGFGNPYGDVWNADICIKWIHELSALGVNTFSLSDTVGIANEQSIAYIFKHIIGQYNQIEFGAHFHTTSNTWLEKIATAYKYGCRRFDGAINGYGGCPMAKNELVGNMPTENLLSFAFQNGAETGIHFEEFIKAMAIANEVFK